LDDSIYRCGSCELDTVNRRFSRDGKDIVLEPKVFAVLVSRPGKLLRREQLLDAVWGHRYVTPSTVNRVIALARRALLDDPAEPTFIQTVHCSGYRYVGPCEETRPHPETAVARFGPPSTARLPARIQSLLGRESELAHLGTLLTAGRSLTIVGTGGMGKTQCALAFGHSQLAEFPAAAGVRMREEDAANLATSLLEEFGTMGQPQPLSHRSGCPISEGAVTAIEEAGGNAGQNRSATGHDGFIDHHAIGMQSAAAAKIAALGAGAQEQHGARGFFQYV
jgi:DNA-binding winged helix-turn-helix (wHTH) protein